MGMQKDLENLLAFNSIGYVIAYGLTPDEDVKISLEHVKTFFQEAIKGLKSMVKRKGPYHIVEDLKEILESNGHYLEHKGALQQEREINQLAKEFGEYIERLDVLDKDPRRFYSEETFKRKNLAYACQKIAGLYNQKVKEEYARIGETSDD
ncbi:Uncharacterised protein [uncultured archaeon]|nr:Uncharacterised protein [uncultured archaeon]